MPRNLILLGLLTIITGIIAGCGMQPEILAMRDVVSPEGYKGRAFFRNGILASEELDSKGNDGKIDLWRYYINNRLTREDFDTTGNGGINMRKRYNNEGVLIEILTDTTGDGRLDHVVKIVPRQTAPVKPTSKPAAKQQTTTAKQKVAKETPTTQAEGKRSVGSEELFGAKRQPEPIPPLNQQPIAPVDNGQANEMTQPQNDTANTASTQTVEPTTEPANNNREPGSVIQRIDVNGSNDYPRSNQGIVPGPVFKHPSEELED